MIFAKLTNGRLTDIRVGPQQPGGLWPDGSQDVPVRAMPSGSGPFAYDSVNQLAVPAVLTASEQTSNVLLPSTVVQALCVQDSARRGMLVPAGTLAWAASVIDSITPQVVATGVSPVPAPIPVGER